MASYKKAAVVQEHTNSRKVPKLYVPDTSVRLVIHNNH